MGFHMNIENTFLIIKTQRQQQISTKFKITEYMVKSRLIISYVAIKKKSSLQ